MRESGRAYSAMAGRTLLLATLFTWLRCGLTLLRTLTALRIAAGAAGKLGLERDLDHVARVLDQDDM